ncbi:PBP1A family penicillin-binding protein [Thalassotalea sp. M1531]|uniref:Penicillin-binding protein 1A n=2 Tax=Thalassotalea algicola TaxID=2716224 RepID=A0A7Y0LAF0_9GAMM|nr:PBP1A family penicillin-binding protein [Thalassotalea algicola]
MSMKSDLPSVASLKDLKWQTPMQVFSQDGKLISQFGEKKRIPLKLNEFPQQLIDAILATEDDRFYSHFGVDPIGVGRAVVAKLMGQNKGGASTITMQVARNFFLTREVTYTRKIREVFLSFHIENLLTKDEILALYLNKIELGHRAFGFGAAAQVYYGKNVNDLSLAQIAVLAGLPKAPSTLNPISRPERAKNRRAVVLQRMLVSGYITEGQYRDANSAPITAKKHGAEIEVDAPYIAEMAHQEMIGRYGKEEAYTGGYKVFLTVPSHLQIAAQQAVITNLLNYDQRHGYRGPVDELRPINPIDAESDTLPVIEPLTETEIQHALNSTASYQQLQPAIVIGMYEKAVTVVLKSGQSVDIPWQGLSWAREYISDQKQGKEPKTASEILKLGDVIYITEKEDVFRLSQLPKASSALVALAPDTGAIQAVVGGFSFKQSQFNRVTQAKRQVGSNIKPFIYSAALDKDYTLATLVNDAPINQWDRSSGFVWRPKNSPPNYDGPIRVRLALAQSKNVIAVRLLRAVGLGNIIDHLSNFGFVPDELPENESLALGSASLTPLEVATGFATFANGGYLVNPYFIERIEDSFGQIIFEAQPEYACDLPCDEFVSSLQPKLLEDHLTQTTTNLEAEQSELLQEVPAALALESDDVTELPPIKAAERVISPQNAFLTTQALNSAIWGADWSVTPGWQGTGFRARSLKRRDIAGKTGTTNEAKDAWFSGYSRRIVATSWIGFDDHTRNLGQTRYNNNLGKNQITGKEFGAKSAQPAWISFMKTALADLPVEPFEPPEDIVSVRIDKATGKLTTKTDKTSIFEYFKLGTAPIDYIENDESSVILDGEPEAEEEIF